MSKKSQGQYVVLKIKTGVTINILARFAICLSLKDPSPAHPELYNQEGMELHPSVLFGEHEKMFVALFLKRLEKDGLDPEEYLQDTLRAHLNRGIAELSARLKGNLLNFYKILEEERNGAN